MTDIIADENVSGPRTWKWAAIALGLLAVVLAVAAVLFYRDSDAPANDSADVGFARDMSTHHAQAVEMANIVYRRSENPDIAFIARDIADTQQFQIGMMTGWLDIWNRSVSSEQPPMAWMGDFDMTLPSPPAGLIDDDSLVDMNMGVNGRTGASDPGADVPLMPGMATQAEVDALKTMPVDEMDAQFLRLMIRHHQGGVLMAQAALEKAKDEHVRIFAQQVINSQNAEIATMTRMLDELTSGSPAPAPQASPVATPETDMPAQGSSTPTP